MNPTRCESPFLINLPSEITISILSRLPIRTIISCKCVCKQFLNLLSAPEFVTSHLSLSNPGLVIRQYGVKDDMCQIIEFEDEFDLQHHNLRDNGVMKFDPSLLFGFTDFELGIIGSVNGIICLHGKEKETKKHDALYLCNPIIREYVALPRIEGIDDYPYSCNYGFGVSRISGQYKVVGNVHRRSQDHQAALHSTTRYHECFVYTLGTSSWRSVQREPI
ncbi:F-box protein At5g18160-like isoform X2 [Henckelia pumila]|uniref:F-box protein At5g18160-like isoform X2 n=1 Tax=Henckelia pumila TaxID=405737 RepID=UPI003C6E2F47